MFLLDMNVFNKQVRQGLRINIPFERGCKNDHLSLSTFKDNLFDLNSVETLSSSTAILAKSVAMLLWERDKCVFSTKITYIKEFCSLDGSLHSLGIKVFRV